ncbi:MAG TPA: hypothetical protein DCM08_07905 [Microscillaceae bacterium]|jgi:hypothetical protein|nr:hypothetical protein [Microscillaceae bacterium]
MTASNAFNFFEYHAQISQDNVLLSYKGPLTDVLLAEFSRDIRTKLQSNRKVGKKVFAIFMELAQNVLYYSKEVNYFGNKDKVGTLVITQSDKYFTLITGNLVYKSSVPLLIEKCEIVNSLDREALREYKRTLRNAPSEEESRGAGIGLVQVALTSDNRIEMKIKELQGDYAFFVISVNVEKNAADDNEE